MMVEPACATSLAAALGPLRDRLRGKRVGVLACGSNTSADRWHENTHGYQPFSIS